MVVALAATIATYFTKLLKGEDREGYIQAIKEEHKSFLNKDVYQVISEKQLDGKKAIPIKVILNRETDAKGNLLKYKARFVCQGFRQIPGVDFDPFEITSSVSRLETLRLLIAISTTLNLDIEQYDVSTAFLNSVIKKDVVVKPPKDLLKILGLKENQYWKLKKTVQ